MRRRQIWIRAVLAASAVACFACAATTFQSTWRSPEVRPFRLTGRKVIAVFLSVDPAMRRQAEDAMAREITARGAQGVPAYTVLSDEEIKDREAAKAKAENLGFSGVVVMRVVGSETQYTYEPGGSAHYHHFFGNSGWGTVSESSNLAVDKIVKVVTLVYSIEQDQLVWAGVSRTFDPGQIESFISALATAVSKQMAKDGLLTRS